MAIVERLQAYMGRNRDETSNKLLQSLYTSWFAPFMPITEPRNFTTDLLTGYMDNEAIYSIVNKIAETCSSIPLEVTNKEGDVINTHWVLDLLKQPNPDNTLKELIFNYYVYLLSIGNSYMYSPFLDDGRSIELWTMPSDLVQVVSGPFFDPVAGYKFKEGNQEIRFAKETVLHGRLFNPRFKSGSWVYGLSPISVAAEIISSLNSGNKATKYSFTNLGPPYIISSQTPEGLTPEQQEMLEATYKKKYGGPESAGKPMLTGTPVKVEKLGSSPVDLNIIQNSEHGWRVLCNVYGVDSILFNDKSASTYNNVSQARKDFYQYTVMPLNDAFAKKLKQFLVPEEDVYFKFNYDGVEVLQDAILTRAETLDKLWYLTPNQKLQMLNMEVSDDPAMDEIYLPANLRQLGAEQDAEAQAFLNKFATNGNGKGKLELQKV